MISKSQRLRLGSPIPVIVFCLLAIGITAGIASATEIQTFDEVYELTIKHYVDPPDPGALAAGAVTGMEEYVVSEGKKGPTSSGSVADLGRDTDYARAKVHESFNTILDSTGVKPIELERAAVKGMLKNLDAHSSYMPPELYKELQVETKGEFGGVGIQIGIKEDRLSVIAPIEDTPAYLAGIKSGDFITKINDEPTKGMTLMDAVQRMRGAKGTKVTLTFERPGAPAPLIFTLVRATIKIQSVRAKMLEGQIGYVRLDQFQENTGKDLIQALSQLKAQSLHGLILDLRNNPGGLLTSAVEVTEQFIMPGKLVVYIKGRGGKKDEYSSKKTETPDDFPMIVLVNEGSASASEIVAGALMDWGRAVIVGNKTFGKGSVQTILPMSGGAGLRLTTAKYHTPKGRTIQSMGIMPDVIVKETESKEKDSADYPLLTAQRAFADSQAYGEASKDKLLQMTRQAAASLGPSSGSLAKAGMPSLPSATGENGDIDRLPAVAARPNKNAYAIVIGIEQYREKLPKADFADKDAKLVGEYLTKVLGYPEENVIVRLNDRATRTDLVKYFEEWLKNNVESGGAVFIYYSGHGTPNTKTGEAYLVPYDGDPSFVDSTAYPVKQLYAALDKLPAKDITVVLDSCFSGSGGRSVLAKGARPMVLSMENPVLASGKTIVLTASGGDQISNSYEEKGHGLLTYYFLKGLQGEGDANKDGVIEMAELFEYIKPNVQRIARKQYNNEQTPQLLASPDALRKGGKKLLETSRP